MEIVMASLDRQHGNSGAQPGFRRWAWLAAAVVAALLIMYLILSAASHTPGPTTDARSIHDGTVAVQTPPSPAPQPAS
jgi:hypothetical protein